MFATAHLNKSYASEQVFDYSGHQPDRIITEANGFGHQCLKEFQLAGGLATELESSGCQPKVVPSNIADRYSDWRGMSVGHVIEALQISDLSPHSFFRLPTFSVGSEEVGIASTYSRSLIETQALEQVASKSPKTDVGNLCV